MASETQPPDAVSADTWEPFDRMAWGTRSAGHWLLWIDCPCGASHMPQLWEDVACECGRVYRSRPVVEVRHGN